MIESQSVALHNPAACAAHMPLKHLGKLDRPCKRSLFILQRNADQLLQLVALRELFAVRLQQLMRDFEPGSICCIIPRLHIQCCAVN
ncbi:hypothetical protein D3C73_1165180 [compost metagenome]